MAITVPKDGDVISAATFGAPVANQVNTNTAALAALLSQSVTASNVSCPANTRTTVATLTVPGSSLPAGRKFIVFLSLIAKMATVGAVDVLFTVGAVDYDHQTSSIGTVGTAMNWIQSGTGNGTNVTFAVGILTWGGQPATAVNVNISVLVLPA